MDRLISEFEVIRAIEKYVDNIFTKNMGDLINDIKAIPSAELSEDAISRDAVLEKAGYTETEEGWCGYTVDVDYIKSLPSVIPQPKTGHWIYDRTRDWDGECKYECSECGMGSDVDYDYCMRCGTKMIEEQERSE